MPRFAVLTAGLRHKGLAVCHTTKSSSLVEERVLILTPEFWFLAG